jgi:hypothetical protein
MWVLLVDPGRYTIRANYEGPCRADCVVQLTANRWKYHSVHFTEIDYSLALWNRDIGLLRCVTDMDSSSFLGRVSWVENIKWNLTVSQVYVNNKGRVIIALFEYISVCYVKPLEWAAVVEVCDRYHIFGRLGWWGGVPTNLKFCAAPKNFKLWSQIIRIKKITDFLNLSHTYCSTWFEQRILCSFPLSAK